MGNVLGIWEQLLTLIHNNGGWELIPLPFFLGITLLLEPEQSHFVFSLIFKQFDVPAVGGHQTLIS